jgi:hypothetical protein
VLHRINIEADMIDITSFAKPKETVKGSTTSTGYANSSGGSSVSYALKAGHADEADKATKATNLDADSTDWSTIKSMDSATLANAIAEAAAKFLSKVDADTAAGLITFLQGLNIGTTTYGIDALGNALMNSLKIGSFSSGLLGSGALIDTKGNAEVESIASRTFMSAKAFVYNLTECNVGERWSTNGFCKVKSVDTIKQIITEELDADEYSTMQVGDICRGTFSDIDSQYTTSDSNADDCGFPTRKGFFTSYFYVAKVISSEKGKCTFQYGLRNSSTPHPCALMTCAQYGNLTDDKRRASIYQCNYPHAFTKFRGSFNV